MALAWRKADLVYAFFAKKWIMSSDKDRARLLKRFEPRTTKYHLMSEPPIFVRSQKNLICAVLKMTWNSYCTPT